MKGIPAILVKGKAPYVLGSMNTDQGAAYINLREVGSWLNTDKKPGHMPEVFTV